MIPDPIMAMDAPMEELDMVRSSVRVRDRVRPVPGSAIAQSERARAWQVHRLTELDR